MMQVKLRVKSRVNLKAHSVGCNSRKMIVPYEAQHPLTLLDSSMLRHALLTISHPIFGRHPLPRPRQANPQEKDIALLEFDVALARDLLNLVQRNHLPTQRVYADAFLLGVGDVID